MKKAVLREFLKNRETYKATVFDTNQVGILSKEPSKPKRKKKSDK